MDTNRFINEGLTEGRLTNVQANNLTTEDKQEISGFDTADEVITYIRRRYPTAEQTADQLQRQQALMEARTQARGVVENRQNTAGGKRSKQNRKRRKSRKRSKN